MIMLLVISHTACTMCITTCADAQTASRIFSRILVRVVLPSMHIPIAIVLADDALSLSHAGSGIPRILSFRASPPIHCPTTQMDRKHTSNQSPMTRAKTATDGDLYNDHMIICSDEHMITLGPGVDVLRQQTKVDHGRPWSTMVDHGRPWSTVGVRRRPQDPE